jgi:KDO2-lipid IV(A) lauroyltransferase
MDATLVMWRASKRAPTWLVRSATGAGGWYVWATRGAAVKRLEGNLHRVTGLEGRALRRLSRQAMASTSRYYAEAFELPRLTEAQIDARVRVVGDKELHEVIATYGGVVAALSHSGNWDLIGAWGKANLDGVIAVAEELKPREMYDEFVALRRELGITIVGHREPAIIRTLVSFLQETGGIAALLADRDMSRRGIKVPMWGHTVSVAPGPAVVAAAAGVPLVPVHVHYEQLPKASRRAAKSKWGIVTTFGAPLDPARFDDETRTQDMSEAWTAWMADRIAAHPEDWHVLQRFGWVE